MKKILVIPARRHILEAYTEYIIRYLGNEFYFEMGYPPIPPYHNIRDRVYTGETSPLEKNPDEFDLIYPHFDTHWFLEPPEKYAKKVATVLLEPAGARFKTAVLAGTSPAVEKSLPVGSHSLRFGVDTEMFKPYPMARTDDLLHVGFIGNIQTPRRYMKELFIEALRGIEGIRLMIFPTTWLPHTRPDEVDLMGGVGVLDNIVDGDKWYPGLPNIYNQMDIFIRADIDHGYQFSVMEAASCGVPVVCTDSGNTKELCDAGGGICINNGGGSWEKGNLDRIAKDIRQKVIFLKENPDARKQMGIKGRKFIEDNWTWQKFVPAWRDFFKKGLEYAEKNV